MPTDAKSKLCAVRISTVAIVLVHEGEDPVDVAREFKRDAMSDPPELDYEVLLADVRSNQLEQFGWDGMCIPYGGDGNTRIKEIVHD